MKTVFAHHILFTVAAISQLRLKNRLTSRNKATQKSMAISLSHLFPTVLALARQHTMYSDACVRNVRGCNARLLFHKRVVSKRCTVTHFINIPWLSCIHHFDQTFAVVSPANDVQCRISGMYEGAWHAHHFTRELSARHLDA